MHVSAGTIYSFFDECVWVEFSTRNGPNLLIGNHYFSPDPKPDLICEYFSHLENKLDTTNYRVILLGDFNGPGFDWEGLVKIVSFILNYLHLHLCCWSRTVC
jgi:hypothetical protein